MTASGIVHAGEPAAQPGEQQAAAPAESPGPTSRDAPAAKQTTNASASAAERAAQLYAEGNAFYDQGKYREAEARYQAAWDLQQSFDVAGNLGNVEMLVGQPRDAAEHLSHAMKIAPLGSGSAEKRKFLQGRLAEARKQVGALQISVNLQGADVFVDGKPVGKSPLETEVFVDPGERVIEARHGGETAKQTVLVAKGSSQPVPLTIETGPDMTIVIAGGAVGVAGLASGLVFTILSNGKASDANALHDELERTGGAGACNSPANQAKCADLSSLREDEALFGNVAVWSFIGGGVALAGTAVYMLTSTSGEPAAEPATGVRAMPVVTAKGAGLILGGRF
ncbi:MAG: hypothetical protein IT372_24505 [Polyangiaceae bacterium]|nr:hypothetical protein [Polyangiaceae bacterium]